MRKTKTYDWWLKYRHAEDDPFPLWSLVGTSQYTSNFINRIWYMCPSCGEAWLKQEPQEFPDARILFNPATGPCCDEGVIIVDRVHRDTNPRYGLDIYPRAILEREFLRMTADKV